MSQAPVPCVSVPSLNYLFPPLGITTIMDCGKNHLGIKEKEQLQNRATIFIDTHCNLKQNFPGKIPFPKFWQEMKGLGDERIALVMNVPFGMQIILS